MYKRIFEHLRPRVFTDPMVGSGTSVEVARSGGGEPHPDDLSRCGSEAEFFEKLRVAIVNQRKATAPGGFYGIIIGNVRRRGRYSSYQAEAIAQMPKEELRAVLIKAQHNMVSSHVRYASMQFPKIMHEYVVLWQRLPSPPT